MKGSMIVMIDDNTVSVYKYNLFPNNINYLLTPFSKHCNISDFCHHLSHRTFLSVYRVSLNTNGKKNRF